MVVKRLRLQGPDVIPPGQLRLLCCLLDAIAERGYPPTRRELMKRYGCSVINGINDTLRALQRKGLVSCTERQARTVQPLVRIEIFKEVSP
jgi:SOS-response transcriptional repressor LexA